MMRDYNYKMNDNYKLYMNNKDYLFYGLCIPTRLTISYLVYKSSEK